MLFLSDTPDSIYIKIYDLLLVFRFLSRKKSDTSEKRIEWAT